MYVVVEWAKPTEAMAFRKKRGVDPARVHPGSIR